MRSADGSGGLAFGTMAGDLRASDGTPKATGPGAAALPKANILSTQPGGGADAYINQGIGVLKGGGGGDLGDFNPLYMNQYGMSNVYMGYTTPAYQKGSVTGEHRLDQFKDTTSTVTKQITAFWTEWSQTERDAFAKRLIDSGVLTAEAAADMDEVGKVWEGLLLKSARMYNNGNGQRYSPMDILDIWTKASTSGVANRKQVNKSYNISSPEEARALLTQTLSQRLGRAPSDKEISHFTSTLTAAEQANPSISTTITDPKGNSSTTSRGGFSATTAAQMAEDQASTAPDYATYQAAGVLFPAMMQALGIQL